jgi:ribonuclease R
MSTQKRKKTHKTTTHHDPAAAIEATRYEFPVPSRVAVIEALNAAGRPVSEEELFATLGVEDPRDVESFGKRLRAMERDGQIVRNRYDAIGLPSAMDMIAGRVIGHPDGFGFLTPEAGGDDLFLPPGEMRKVLHGDRALARVTGVDRRGRKEGAIISVVERLHKTVVGRYQFERGSGLVWASDRRISQPIMIPPGEDGGARNELIVVAEIVRPPTGRLPPSGRIVEVLGEHLAPGMEVEIAIRMHELPREFPDAVRDEIADLPNTVPGAATQGRLDLRDLPLVTIDGEDARDFDDAVYAERHGKEFRLIVAIADVSSYVSPGTALDREALARGNSVYFPNYVIPMLPEVLSNGLCSLNPDVDRLCMACDMRIDARGTVKSYRFHEAVMRSHARLTYTKAAAMLVERNAPLRREYARIVEPLETVYALFKVLLAAREKRGAIDFDLPETKIVYNDERKIERIEPATRNDAHRLIEECMLVANVCAAEFLRDHKRPAPYRVHPGPSPEKLTALREMLFEMGLQLKGGEDPEAKHYAELLDAVAGKPQARLLHTSLLRSLGQAQYNTDNTGHFALAYPCYTHFTSPIRRYPDLMVHRAIKSVLKRHRDESAVTQAAAEHCSMTERRADDATRDVIRWLKAEFMQEHVGEEFDGFVSGVTSFGIFVELADLLIDGLVHMSALGDDYYHFDPVHHRLTGERTRQTYRLGDPVRVRVMRVDLDEAKIDFELAERGGKQQSRRGSARRRGKRRVG